MKVHLPLNIFQSQQEGTKKKKKKKKRGQRMREMAAEARAKMCPPATPTDPNIEIDWRTEGLERSNPTYYIFNKIFEKFKLPEPAPETLPSVETMQLSEKGL